MMIDRHVIKWIRLFKKDRTDTRGEQMNGKPSVVSLKLVQQVEEKVYNDRRMTCVAETYLHFWHSGPLFLKRLLLKII